MLEFDEDSTSAVVRVPIVNDAITEPDESFFAILTLVEGEEEEVPPVVLEPAFANVLIVDDDFGKFFLCNRKTTLHGQCLCIMKFDGS